MCGGLRQLPFSYWRFVLSLLVFGMPADQVKLSEIANLVSEYGDVHDWDEFLVMKVNLLLEELVLNVRDYGEISGRRFDVEIDSNSDRVCLDFSDNGVPFDPTTEAPAPDLVSGLDQRRAGGLGVHLVCSFADSIAYRYEDGRNMLSVGLCT